MSLPPITIYGNQFTSAEATFLQNVADHAYTDGQLLIGNSATGGISFATLTAGSGITITNGNGTISISASAASAPFADTTAIVYNAADNTKQVKLSAASITTGTTRTLTVPDANDTIAVLAATQAFTNKTYNGLTVTSTTGTFTLTNGKTLSVSNTLTFTGTDSSSIAFGGGGTVAYTANNLSVFAATTSAQLAGVISDETGSGALVFATSPSLTTPTLGVASATTINKVTITAPATGSTLTIADGKTLTLSNTLTFTGTDSSSVAFGAGGTVVYTTVTTLSSLVSVGTITTGTWSATTIAINKGGTGVTSVTTAPTASAWAGWDANSNFSANNLIEGFTTTATAAGTTTLTIASTYTQVFTGSTTQTVKLPTTSVVAGGQYSIINQSTGAVTVQSSGANTITVLAAGTSGTFTAVVATPTTAANWNSQYFGVNVTSGKSLSVSNTLTLAGTDSTTMTFPSTSATIARTDAGQTFTGVQVFTSPKIITQISDTNGNILLNIGATASAVNYVKVTNAATGTAGPILSADGETNVDLKIAGKGTGGVHVTTGSYGDITADSDGATITFNLATSNIHSVTLGGNRTLALSNDKAGQVFILRLKQDGTGTRTVTWFSGISWAGGSAPTLTTTINKADMFGFVVTTAGSAYDGFVIGQNI